MPGLLRKILIGKPLPTDAASYHRLGNFAALAVFASDALSSVAYATEEMLLVLILAGPFYLHLGPYLSLAIVALLLIVTMSYRQTIRAYPSGGGAYTVAKENLGTLMGLVAGSALLIDYVLTVAVSVAAGIAAITSALPELFTYRVSLALLAVAVITIGNLRGVKESGRLFSAPAYAFIFGIGTMIIVGLWKYAHALLDQVPPPEVLHQLQEPKINEAFTLFLLLRAFSSGCTALTGVEAISNGVRAFQKPESENAARVLRWLAMILGALFLGVSGLAYLYQAVPISHETIVSQLARSIFGAGFFYYFIQAATCAVLILAANTSFADFPRLASVMARDRFLPRQLQNLGDRLVFSNGILLLATFAGLLLYLFGASTHRLIPLYAVGVFLSFTLSQFGMVMHHYRLKEPEWRIHLTINLVGAISTAVVLMAVLITKFSHGAWIICLILPLLVTWLYAVWEHYQASSRQLASDLAIPLRHFTHTVIVPVAQLHRGVVAALEYARSLSKNVKAVTVELDEKATESLKQQWSQWAPDVPLVVLESPYRSLNEPLIEYIKKVDDQDPNDLITVVIPSFVPARWWHNFLHNQSAILLQAGLRNMRNVVVTSVRIHLDR